MAVTEGSVEVGSVSDFPENTMHPVRVGDRDVLLVHQGGAFYALEDRCTHKAYPLHNGELLEGAVKCDWHGAKFDLKTGKPTLPAVKKVRLYETRVEGDKVLVVYQEG